MARGSAHLNVSGPAEGVNEHKWLISTSRFAGEMIPFWKTTRENFLESRQNLGTQEGIENDVVLALIDDGVDMFDDSLTSQILEGKSFDFHGGKVRPPFSSAKGHGTIMASMILRVCPMVKVYPIRLRTHATLEGKNMNIDARYAAQVSSWLAPCCFSGFGRCTMVRMLTFLSVFRLFKRRWTKTPQSSQCRGPFL